MVRMTPDHEYRGRRGAAREPARFPRPADEGGSVWGDTAGARRLLELVATVDAFADEPVDLGGPDPKPPARNQDGDVRRGGALEPERTRGIEQHQVGRPEVEPTFAGSGSTRPSSV